MIKRKKIKYNSGYIALISAIIISVLLMTLSTTLSMTGFFARFDVLNSEFKERSIALAEACGDVAMLNIANENYAPESNHPVDNGDTCDIISIEPNSPGSVSRTITTQARFPKAGSEQAWTTIQIMTNPDLTILSWKEI